jgi:DsbC/DsbD-like thiol-disulfide interchange protein
MFTAMSVACVRCLGYVINNMHSGIRFARILPLLAMAWLVAAMASAAVAADASPWADDIQSAVRLIAGRAPAEPGERALRAGLQIKLQPGWKTYWRYPGDSGIPPSFDFSASENVKTVTVSYPAPQRFADGAGGHSIGYQNSVILPLRIVPRDAAKPVTLRLKLDYAVCEKLCLPISASLELEVTGGESAHEAALAAAEAQVPKREALGRGVPAIRAVQRQAGSGNTKARVIVDVAAPAGASLSLFAEGPTADWALPLPEAIAGAPAGLQRFAFELDGLPPGARPDGVMLLLTAVAGDQATEVAIRLD